MSHSGGLWFKYEQRKALWSSMRRLRAFTQMDLESGAEVSRVLAARWLLMCQKAGYIAPVVVKRAGKRDPRTKAFRLVRDIGPIPPVLKAGCLIDSGTDAAADDPEVQMVPVPRAEFDHALRCVRACAGLGDDPEAAVAKLRALAGETA
ncbi:hypothetical protein [Hydrocarboniphaga effusa]|uniref:hypothetical protein n=1 Tax=Hydrocarboniphaga effusa TaxID=243629 RepID=UPI003BA89EC1